MPALRQPRVAHVGCSFGGSGRAVALVAGKVAVAMGAHSRLGHASLLHLLSSDLVQYIGMLLEQRRSGERLCEGEAMIERSPSVSRIIADAEAAA